MHHVSRHATIVPMTPKWSTRGCSFQENDETGNKKGSIQSWPYCPSNLHFSLSISFCRLCNFIPFFFFVKESLQWAESKSINTNHDATRSGVSASTDNKAVCTLSNQLSRRSRKDLICGTPKTLGCTQDTCTVPSTWSIIPSIRWTCNKNLAVY